jgi:hypothetical protein
MPSAAITSNSSFPQPPDITDRCGHAQRLSGVVDLVSKTSTQRLDGAMPALKLTPKLLSDFRDTPDIAKQQPESSQGRDGREAPSSSRKRNFSPRKDGSKAMTPSQLGMRLEVFRYRLVEIVKRVHDKFLTALSSPVQLSLRETASLQRWHPSFRLDKHVPDIPAAPLPQPPRVELLATPEQVFRKVPARRLTPGTPDALNKLSMLLDGEQSRAESTKESTPQNASGVVQSTPSGKLLKGISPALLNKIREKEAARSRHDMLRSPAAELRRRRLDGVLELIRKVNGKFEVNKFRPIPRTKLLESLAEGRWGHDDEAVARLDLMKEEMSDWIEEFVPGAGTPIAKADAVPHIRMKGKHLKLDDLRARIQTLRDQC